MPQNSNLNFYRDAHLNAGLRELPITGEIGIRAVEWIWYNRDPADWLFVVTAQLHHYTLITAEDRTLTWDGRLDRVNATT